MPEAFIETVANIAPTFGGINLEDIAAPRCFAIEESLRERLNIPVFHDDQHGTAIVVCAGLVNALEVQGKPIEDVRIVIQGAGAAGIATARLLRSMGVPRDNIAMVDSKGVIHSERTDLNVYKQAFAIETPLRTTSEAMIDADVLIGLSGPDTVSPEMIQRMSTRSIVFALSNPDPEIYPEKVREISEEIVMATGRSDYPNQVNNSLVFPFIFRAALDARVSTISQEMLIAAVHALAELARMPVPDEVRTLYPEEALEFGAGYILPKQFDPRLCDHMVSGIRKAIVTE